ncbi:MAG: BadF/BadG/BcrA/BcrD ATPase family protein [Deferribacterota bacterium]|nr:BadF/BadG/BcrA/BcrD ATPase family protein [Deferribacterota bacterium]
MNSIFIGIDGGASKTDLLIEDEDGRELFYTQTGPSNISLSPDSAWKEILKGINIFFLQYKLDVDSLNIYAGMGLAGLENRHALKAFLRNAHNFPFKKLIVESDAYTACLGAHLGKDGIAVIVGTGSVAVAICKGKTYRVGGWGFLVSDEGSGAWIGLTAIKKFLYYYDGRINYSPLFDALFKCFDERVENIVSWSERAKSTDYAKFAKLVVEQANKSEPIALSILFDAANKINLLIEDLDKKIGANSLDIALIGSIAPFLKGFISDNYKNRLINPKSPPVKGAIYMIRDSLNKGWCL